MAANRGVGKNKAKCVDCGKIVGGNEKGIQCEVCSNWFHGECQAVTEEEYNTLSRSQAMHWFCEACNRGAAGVFKMLSEMSEKQKGMEDEIKQLRKEMEGIKKEGKEVQELAKEVEVKMEAKLTEELNKNKVNEEIEMTVVKKEIEEIKKSYSEALSLKSNGEGAGDQGPDVSRLSQIQIKEGIERDKRMDKLIVMGIKEEDDVKEVVGNIVSKLIPENPERIEFKVLGRIGKEVKDKLRPVRIEIADLYDRRRILSRAKELKNTPGMERIYIVPDLTRLQQEQDLKLRTKFRELKREPGMNNIKIEKGSIVDKTGGGNRVVFKVSD